jgi:polyhydroxyalkanoate synthesis regulator phasin
MAEAKQKDAITRLAEQGEEALQRIAEALGGVRFVEAMNSMRERVDDLSKKIRSLDPLEKRVTDLERRLDALSKPERSTRTRRAAATRTSTGTARKPSTRGQRKTG